ncbi:unnamed protein product [Brassicogethes aeneus]|uniref:Protein SPT2 homolog n=1 Tax=Brassicogethes aeneus TaxID=1431903 RepID=A0A9P0BCE8_BRAAE|nr:unnamed protein product [Brassicogethes aeneus]
MDFGSVLHTATKNEKSQRKEIKYYSTKFEPPKKQQRSKELSVNVKKFLERKEQEEKQKLAEAQQRKEELLALRSKDRKAVKRVNVMLKRTKSANQSVIQDAVDDNNTAVTMAGPYQPDEDDYGYVSQEASAYYNKLMEKYSKMPDEKKFDFTKKKVSTNLKNTKDRVKAALEREREEALLPHKRKRKAKEVESDTKESSAKEEYDKYEPEKPQENVKPKPKNRPPPPSLNFAELLKIAEKKQFEPIVIEQKVDKDERLLTKKQRRELEEERILREKKELREKERLMYAKKPKVGEKSQKSNPDSGSNRIPKLNGNKPATMSPIAKNASKLQNALTKSDKERGPIPTKSFYNSKSPQTSSSNLNTAKKVEKKPLQFNSKPSTIPPKPKEFPPRDMQPKNRPPMKKQSSDLRPQQTSTQKQKHHVPPPDMSRFPMKNKKPALQVNKRRILDDDDSEYDSEMDDFIDDGPDDEDDYSKHISEIFGYDKSRYRDVEEDVDNMESTFAQQMKEEAISKKIGIQEDLEDIRMEEEHKKRKKMLNKRR